MNDTIPGERAVVQEFYARESDAMIESRLKTVLTESEIASVLKGMLAAHRHYTADVSELSQPSARRAEKERKKLREALRTICDVSSQREVWQYFVGLISDDHTLDRIAHFSKIGLTEIERFERRETERAVTSTSGKPLSGQVRTDAQTIRRDAIARFVEAVRVELQRH